jgi:hypothetical protein
MKFLYSDTQDYVDPGYDFIEDRNAPGRKRYWDDMYAHEIMSHAPYDGLLVSMSAIRQAEGVVASKVRYTTAEEQRFLRNGARNFLRFGGPKFSKAMLMGDCGAFAYVEHELPAYAPNEVVDFYDEAGFTHGVSPDHIIFDCDLTNPPSSAIEFATIDRYEITLENALEFFKLTQKQDFPFEPMGAVQGWSPKSMAASAKKLVKMGYKYLAIGGLVPLKVTAIHEVLLHIRKLVPIDINIHLLGFAKADHIHQFLDYGITSFDSTSPFIKAFKDQKTNYYLPKKDGGLDYYAAIRIPQAIENTRLVRGMKKGLFDPAVLLRKEKIASDSVRSLDAGTMSGDSVLQAVMDYHQFLIRGEGDTLDNQENDLKKTELLVARTIKDMPWKHCDCDICRKVGVEVIIFRSSNRNKRRGFHNLHVYHQHLQKTMSNKK